jgi:hypothetical protein
MYVKKILSAGADLDQNLEGGLGEKIYDFFLHITSTYFANLLSHFFVFEFVKLVVSVFD